jgi:hypothetical protein
MKQQQQQQQQQHNENTTTSSHMLMSFIYSAMADGWSVKMLSENKWCFTKKNVKKHYSVQTFLRKHMNHFNI